MAKELGWLKYDKEEERKNKVIEEYLVTIKKLRENLEGLIKSKTFKSTLQKTKEIIEDNIDNLEYAVKNSIYLKNGEYISRLSKDDFDKAITFIRHGEVKVNTGKLNKDNTPKVKSKKQAELEIEYFDKNNEKQLLKLIHKTTQDIIFKSGKTKAKTLFCSLDDLESGLTVWNLLLNKALYLYFPKTNATLITLSTVVAVAATVGGIWSIASAINSQINTYDKEINVIKEDYVQNITEAQNDVKNKINSLVKASANWNAKVNGEEALKRLEIYKNAFEKFTKEEIVADVSKLPKSAEEILGADDGKELEQEIIEQYMENLFANIDLSSSDIPSLVNQSTIAKEYSDILLNDLNLIEQSVQEYLVKTFEEQQLTKIDFTNISPNNSKVKKVIINFNAEINNIKIYSVRHSIVDGLVETINCLQIASVQNIKDYLDDNEMTDGELQKIISDISNESLMTYTDYSNLREFYEVNNVYLSNNDIARAMIGSKNDYEISAVIVNVDGSEFTTSFKYNNNGKDQTNLEVIDAILSAVKTNYDSQDYNEVTVDGLKLDKYNTYYDLFSAMDEEK